MKTGNTVIAAGVALALGGCVTTETVSYKASATQQNVIRDGVGALISSQPSSVVMLRPAGRGVPAGQRPVYVLAVQNRTPKPVDLRVADIKVIQTKQGQYARALNVKTYEQLVDEEKTRQVFAAIGVGLGAAGNSIQAANAGHGTATTHTPHGTYHTTYYSPAANQIAVANANAQNNRNIAAFANQAEANMAALEGNVLKDNTVMPGEWIGGTVTFEPPRKEYADGKAKSYSIGVKIGEDTHVIEITQAPGA
ncbi:hypothetical protein [Flaviflagellibacter deserti]|uniref:Lipoprotein n=1 Tax=Flaviflagellibacter deserti TaxID=2267266 RepID=A0ABV9Z5B9_9HYPH